MKTLLLTLVVVTIVCLDLGDSLICYVGYNIPQICPTGEVVCFTKTWCDAHCGERGKRVELGCAATCPIVKPGIDITCCSTNNCNPFPFWPRPRPGR
uniref:3FTx-Ver-5 n=1 Tax=Vermicella annulata TaxID=1295044 RepID=R4FKG3_9SAUR